MPPRSSLAALVLVLSLAGCGDGGPGAGDGDETAQGRNVYAANCAVCHGADLRGTDQGPPLLDVIYAPNHHPDDAFRAAIAHGVVPHHWNFGPMPPIPALDDDDVEAVIAYIRSVQQREGITHDPNRP